MQTDPIKPESESESPACDGIRSADIEARLAALSSKVEQEVAEENHGNEIDLLERFLSDDTQSQLLVREIKQDSTGETETATSLQKIRFAVQQQRHVLHLAFEPDLCQTPQVQARIVIGGGRIKVTHAEKFGVRLEVILPTPSDDLNEVVIEIVCTASYNPC